MTPQVASSPDACGGELFLEDLFNADDGDQERGVVDDEARVWLQHRATASKSDESIALRRHVLAQKAVVAVRRAVVRLNSGSFAVQTLQMLGQRLAVHHGLAVAIRTSAARAANTGGLGFRLPHAFLLCRPTEGVEVLVDPAFRKQFELGRCTRQYSAFLAMCIPDVFVGTREMLTPLVTAAAAAAAASFAKLGMALPPWRCADKLLARWLPARPVDTVCDATSAMAAEQSVLRRSSSSAVLLSSQQQQQQGRQAQAVQPHAVASRHTKSAGALLRPQEIIVGFVIAPPESVATPVTSASADDPLRHPSPSSRLHCELQGGQQPLLSSWQQLPPRPAAVQRGGDSGGDSGGGATATAAVLLLSDPQSLLLGRFTMSEGSARSLPVPGGPLSTKSSVPDLTVLARTCRPFGRHVLTNSSVHNSSNGSLCAVAPPGRPFLPAAVAPPPAAFPACKPRLNLKLLGVENLLPRMRTVKLGA